MTFPGLSFSDDQLFSATNLVFPAWILLIIAPGHRGTQAVCLLVSLILCILYAGTFFSIITSAPEGTSVLYMFKEMGSLEGVQKLLGNPDAAVACWVHYCVADLWIGRWIAIDAGRRHIPRILMVPILFLACMMCPVGLGLYLLCRGTYPEVRTNKSKAH